jgi:hypothetical protein
MGNRVLTGRPKIAFLGGHIETDDLKMGLEKKARPVGGQGYETPARQVCRSALFPPKNAAKAQRNQRFE